MKENNKNPSAATPGPTVVMPLQDALWLLEMARLEAKTAFNCSSEAIGELLNDRIDSIEATLGLRNTREDLRSGYLDLIEPDSLPGHS